jgi:hypothetical protein
MRKVLLAIGFCLLSKLALAGWLPLVGATDLNFQTGVYYGCGNTIATECLTPSNTTGGTDLLPSSASGASFNTFAANTLRITPGLGLLVEQAHTNYLANSGAPATQTTPSLGTGTYILWVNGSGSATMSAGTATGCGTSASTQGTKVTVTITVAGTCVVTVAGSLNEFQLENDSTGLSYCPSTINGGVCASDNTIAKGPLLAAFQQSSTFAVLVQTYQITGAFSRIIGYNAGTTDSFVTHNSPTQAQCFNGTVTFNVNLGTGKNYNTGVVKSSYAQTPTAMTLIAGNGAATTTAATAISVTNVYIGFAGNTSDWVNGYIQEIIVNGSSTPFSTN